ncbi:MAG: hypothetical protein RIT45_7 [Pseudomonadota bacterium]|jgi:hypothetical protein
MPGDAAERAAYEAALARNDAFLRDVVERLESCPFARGCREEGGLWRAVSWADPAQAPARMLALAEALQAQARARRPEVALMVLPGLSSLSAAAFDALHLGLREAYEALPTPRFYVVAFHPDYPVDARSPATLVRFWRRSPDPTLQFVAREVLAPLRRSADEADRVRRAAELIEAGAGVEELERALRPPRDLSARVAEQNARRFAEDGEAIRAAVDALCERGRRERELHGSDPSWPDYGWETVR